MRTVSIAYLEVHGLLVFSKIQESIKESTLSPGPMIRTHPFIHNYPLIYGFLGYSSETIMEKTDPPSYRVVSEAIREGFYVYPAEPIHVSYTRIFLSPTPETLAIPEKAKPRLVHPLQVHYYAVGPGSLYKTIIIHDPQKPLPRYIRIGKKRWGIIKARIIRPDKIVEAGPLYKGYSTIPVNIGDMKEMGVDVRDYSAVLVTRNNPFIGEKSIIGYVRAAPMYKITYSYRGRIRAEYVPLPRGLVAG